MTGAQDGRPTQPWYKRAWDVLKKPLLWAGVIFGVLWLWDRIGGGRGGGGSGGGEGPGRGPHRGTGTDPNAAPAGNAQPAVQPSTGGTGRTETADSTRQPGEAGREQPPRVDPPLRLEQVRHWDGTREVLRPERVLHVRILGPGTNGTCAPKSAHPKR